MTITVYTQPGCMPCAATVRKLSQLGIAHTAIPADDISPGLLDTAISEHGAERTAPLVVIEERGEIQQAWGGYRPERIVDLAPRLAA